MKLLIISLILAFSAGAAASTYCSADCQLQHGLEVLFSTEFIGTTADPYYHELVERCATLGGRLQRPPGDNYKVLTCVVKPAAGTVSVSGSGENEYNARAQMGRECVSRGGFSIINATCY